jgi:hypothetical protein
MIDQQSVSAVSTGIRCFKSASITLPLASPPVNGSLMPVSANEISGSTRAPV